MDIDIKERLDQERNELKHRLDKLTIFLALELAEKAKDVFNND